MKNGLAFFFVHCAKVKSISISNRENSREDVPLNFLSQLQKWRCHAYIWYLSTTLHNGVVSFLEKHSCFHSDVFIYRTCAIITRGLYIFYPIFHCGLYCRAVSVTDNLCTKQGNSSIFGSKIRGL